MIQAIKTNDLAALSELDVSSTEKLITVNWVNHHEDYQLEEDSFYGAIGWAIYCKADLVTFKLLVAKGAPSDRVRYYGKWYGARQACHDLGLAREIVNLFPKQMTGEELYDWKVQWQRGEFIKQAGRQAAKEIARLESLFPKK